MYKYQVPVPVATCKYNTTARDSSFGRCDTTDTAPECDAQTGG